MVLFKLVTQRAQSTTFSQCEMQSWCSSGFGLISTAENHGSNYEVCLHFSQQSLCDLILLALLAVGTNIDGSAPSEHSVWLYVETNSMEVPRSLTAPQKSPSQEQKSLGGNGDRGEQPGKVQKGKKRAVHFDISLPTFKPGKRKAQDEPGQNNEAFEASQSARKQGPPPSESKQELCHSTLNLSHADSICSHFSSTCKEACLGYLNADTRLVFYSTGTPGPGRRQDTMEKTLPLNEILEGMPILQQLQLAHLLATVVLRFHSTPWLAPDWHLKDMFVFGTAPNIDEDLLQLFKTLHLSVSFPDANTHAEQQGPPAEGNATADLEPNIAHLHGLGNMTLAHLGVALLEIGYKQEIARFRTSREPHDVVTARGLLDGRPTALGTAYQNIIRKCVDCDFALGKDLENEKLQSAVYSDVVCSLESMTKKCESLMLGP